MNLALKRNLVFCISPPMRILTQRDNASWAAYSNKWDNVLVVKLLPNLALTLNSL